MSVGVNPPKTPVTTGSNGIATATLPNMCKMPGPPAPFVPAPLPNIGKSGDNPKDYTKTVKIEGNPVAIKGASFCSIGDMASKGTGGGMVSANTHGPCKFIGPGSMDVKFEGKNVQLLSDPMTNNGGGSGSPANSATMMGEVQGASSRETPQEDPKTCDHDWKVKEAVPGKSIEDEKADNKALSDSLAAKPSKETQKRGYDFANIAIDANKEKLDIQCCGREYFCPKCGIEQEVDIVGKDQIAETKSRSSKGVKNKKQQCNNYLDIQKKLFKADTPPLAKLDGTKPDCAESRAIYDRRGFSTEIVG